MDLKKVFMIILGLFAVAGSVFATQQQLDIEMSEYVNQTVIYNPLKAGEGTWYDANENQTRYNLTGYINVTNVNPGGEDLADIFIQFVNTDNITLPVLIDGRNGTFVSNNPSSNVLILHIPQLRNGESSVWQYSIDGNNIRPPLNFTSSYSDTKVLAGNNVTVYDNIQNVFDNYAFQNDTCIYDINVSQVTVPINFSGTFFNYTLIPSSVAGTDAGNTVFAGDGRSMYWEVEGGNCLYQTNATDINYIVNTPYNIPKTTDYYMINSTLSYTLNQTISHLRVDDIKAIGEANLSFEKKIIAPSHPTLYGSNVTWNITSDFSTATNISYILNGVSMWVSERNVMAGVYTDPNTIDVDTISGDSLNVSYSPFVLVNSSSPWSSPSWQFNYSDLPSPIVWMDVNFTISNDGTQLINRSVTRNEDDIYIKEIYLILGYWLEIEKNITSIAEDVYHVKIDVHNKGNQVTPADTIVTIYDFVPSNYANGTMTYSTSPWYNTAHASNAIVGDYDGTLHQWGLVPTNVINTSFDAGPAKNENTTWSVEFNVTGSGDYELLDVFVTGLDPQQVDGAGSTKAVIVSEVVDRLKSTEGIFAAVASVLLLLGLLI